MISWVRIKPLGLMALLLAAYTAFPSDKPEIRVTARLDSDKAPYIFVEASDSEGLDSIEITCRECDLSYHLQLSRDVAGRQFRRSFTLPEMFQTAQWKYPVRLGITVRNTRGTTAGATVVLDPNKTEKGK